ncbi:MAG: hypothetical protein ACK5TP_05045 [bacterium]
MLRRRLGGRCRGGGRVAAPAWAVAGAIGAGRLVPTCSWAATGTATAVAWAVDDNTLAGQILLRKRFTLLGEEDLG